MPIPTHAPSKKENSVTPDTPCDSAPRSPSGNAPGSSPQGAKQDGGRGVHSPNSKTNKPLRSVTGGDDTDYYADVDDTDIDNYTNDSDDSDSDASTSSGRCSSGPPRPHLPPGRPGNRCRKSSSRALMRVDSGVFSQSDALLDSESEKGGLGPATTSCEEKDSDTDK